MTFEEFKRLNEEKGFHWFTRCALSFFNSKTSNWDARTGHFISSERGPSGIRGYTVRRGNFETGQVATIGVFQEHSTLARAKQAMIRHIKES